MPALVDLLKRWRNSIQIFSSKLDKRLNYTAFNSKIEFRIKNNIEVLSEFLIISCGLQSMMTVSRMGHLEIEFGNVEWTNSVSFATQSTPALSILIGRNPDEWEIIFKTSWIPELLVNPVKSILPVSESTFELSWQLSGPRNIPFFKSFLFPSHNMYRPPECKLRQGCPPKPKRNLRFIDLNKH